MIGRFLLGAGLGALLGTGSLALLSLSLPGPAGDGPPGQAEAPDVQEKAGAPEAAAKAPVPAPADEPEPPVAPEAAEKAPAAPPEAGTEPAVAPEAAEDAPVAPPVTPPATAPATPPVAPPVAPSVTPPAAPADEAATPSGPDDPGAASGPETATAPVPAETVGTAEETAPAGPPPVTADLPPAAPPAPAEAETLAPPAEVAAEDAGPLPAPPATLALPAPEAAPEAPEQPAAAPDLATAAAPTAPEEPGTVPDPADVPAGENPPRAPGQPPEVVLVAPEAAPEGSAPPGPPPLTEAEKALLAEIARNGPGTALAPGEGQPEGPADPGADPAAQPETAAEAPAPMPEIIVPDSAAEPPGDAGKRIVVGEGSTLPSVPALDDRPAAQPTDEAAEGVILDRLPRIGDDGAEGAAVDDRPIVRNARPFENTSGKPAFAVILIDDGDPALDRAALAALPFPVSFALDPLSPDASTRAEIYRAAGQEVLMLASGLPAGASASDVEVAFQTMLQALPQAVAVLDVPQRAFQGDRTMAGNVVPVVKAEGLGLVTWDEGLNAADQVARRADVPATAAFRALDSEGESAQVIRRYLDRAAFKAAQVGQVTVIGTTRPETVAALLEWTVEGRAATVALAPVTAVLRVD